MIVISTASHYLIDGFTLSWNEETEVTAEQADYFLTFPGVVAKNEAETEILTEPEILPSATSLFHKE